MAAAEALANLITDEELNEEYIIPKAFDHRVGSAVAKAVAPSGNQKRCRTTSLNWRIPIVAFQKERGRNYEVEASATIMQKAILG